MIGSSASIVRSFCTLAVIILCASCASSDFKQRYDQFGYEDHVDLTSPSSSGVANIRGRNRNFIGLFGEYCWVKSPGNAKRVTVDAGPIDIVAACVFVDSVTTEFDTFHAAFHFDALAGHEYEIGGRCRDCIRLRDATTDEVVAENPDYLISRDPRSGPSSNRIPEPEEMITIDPSEEVVVAEAYVRFYECPEPYVLAEYPIDHYWLVKRKVTLSCVAPGLEMTTIEPGEEVKVLARRYVRFYKCPEPYVMVEGKTFLGLSSTLTCEEPSSSNDE